MPYARLNTFSFTVYFLLLCFSYKQRNARLSVDISLTHPPAWWPSAELAGRVDDLLTVVIVHTYASFTKIKHLSSSFLVLAFPKFVMHEQTILIYIHI